MSSKSDELSLFELEEDRVFRALKSHEVGSEEYVKVLDVMIKLHKMKVEEKPSSVSKDTLALMGAHLLGIILVIRHEHVNVITSRAMNMVPRLRP